MPAKLPMPDRLTASFRCTLTRDRSISDASGAWKGLRNCCSTAGPWSSSMSCRFPPVWTLRRETARWSTHTYRSRDHSAAAYARSRNALLANATREFKGGGYLLSPSSLVDIPSGTALVLPSPNGSTLSLSTGGTPTFAGCLRNATALAGFLQRYETGISSIPAGNAGSNNRPSGRDRRPDRRGCRHSCAGRHPFAGSRSRRPRFRSEQRRPGIGPLRDGVRQRVERQGIRS